MVCVVCSPVVKNMTQCLAGTAVAHICVWLAKVYRTVHVGSRALAIPVDRVCPKADFALPMAVAVVPTEGPTT